MLAPELLAEVRRWVRFAREDLDAAERLLREEAFVSVVADLDGHGVGLEDSGTW